MNLDFSVWGIVLILGCILISMVVHEYMHAFAGYKLGDSTARDEGRLTLNPLAHIDPILTIGLPLVMLLMHLPPVLAAKPVPFTPGRVRKGEFGAAVIAAAGPLSNLGLAIIASLLGHAASGEVLNALQTFMVINVALFVFNMLPLPPLDGSRVLYAFSPRPLRDLLERVEPYGFMIIIILVVMGGFGGALTTLNDIVLSMLP
ncbi:MAG: site-2 protease family protein [Candidatus Saccharimonadales bacterium]